MIRTFSYPHLCMYYRFEAYLEVLPQFVHHPSVLAPYLLAPRAAVGGVVADMDARSRERGALSAGTCGALGGALTLGAVIRVEKIPFPHEVNAAVGLAGGFLLSGDREARTGLCAKQQCQNGRAYCALQRRALTENHDDLFDPPQKVKRQVSEVKHSLQSSWDLADKSAQFYKYVGYIVTGRGDPWRYLRPSSTVVCWGCAPFHTEPGRGWRLGA